MYSTIFTNDIWSYLLCPPLIVFFSEALCSLEEELSSSPYLTRPPNLIVSKAKRKVQQPDEQSHSLLLLL